MREVFIISPCNHILVSLSLKIPRPTLTFDAAHTLHTSPAASMHSETCKSALRHGLSLSTEYTRLIFTYVRLRMTFVPLFSVYADPAAWLTTPVFMSVEGSSVKGGGKE